MLARAGCDVVLTGTGKPADRYPEDERAAGWRDIESVADEIRALGRRALPLVSDVCDPEAVERLAARVQTEMGRVDIVVNNAGSTRGPDRQPVAALPASEWRRVVDTNLKPNRGELTRIQAVIAAPTLDSKLPPDVKLTW